MRIINRERVQVEQPASCPIDPLPSLRRAVPHQNRGLPVDYLCGHTALPRSPATSMPTTLSGRDLRFLAPLMTINEGMPQKTHLSEF